MNYPTACLRGVIELKLCLTIDDTEDFASKGIDEIAEEIAYLIRSNNLGITSVVTEEQLYMDSPIPCTSNNIVCFQIDNVNEEDHELIIDIALEHIKYESSSISEPGLYIYSERHKNCIYANCE